MDTLVVFDLVSIPRPILILDLSPTSGLALSLISDRVLTIVLAPILGLAQIPAPDSTPGVISTPKLALDFGSGPIHD
jgi:hypothetical protein